MIFEYQHPDGKVILRNFNSKKRKRIPDTITVKGIKCNRIWSAPMVMMEPSKPKTMGTLAEKNTIQKIKSGEIKEKKKTKPWWRQTDKVDTSLHKLSASAKQKYIMTGKK